MKNDILSAIRSEIKKVIYLGIPTRIFLWNSILVTLFLLLNYLFSQNSTEENGTEFIWNAHSFYSQIIFVLVIFFQICSQFGKEFEWRTMHQFFIKGLTPSALITSKFLVYFTLYSLQFTIYTGFCLGLHFFFQTSGEEIIPWTKIGYTYIGVGILVGFSLFFVSLFWSGTSAVIAMSVYLFGFELIGGAIWDFLFKIYPDSGILSLKLVLFPYGSYLELSAGDPSLDPLPKFFLIFGWMLVLILGSYFRVRQKEFGISRN
jgi:hypothetical protein